MPDDLRARIEATLAGSGLIRTLGITLEAVEAGAVTLRLPLSPAVTQQHGFVHAAAVTAALDHACGCAVATLLPADTGVLTGEYKVNFLRPASGPVILARARVVRAGRTLSVCLAEGFNLQGDGQETQIALMTATLLPTAIPHRTEPPALQ